MIKFRKACILFILVLSVSKAYSQPERCRVKIPTYLREEPKKTTPVKKNVIKVLKANQECKIINFKKGWFLIETEKNIKGWLYFRLVHALDENGNIIRDYDPYKDPGWDSNSPKKIKPQQQKEVQIVEKEKKDSKKQDNKKQKVEPVSKKANTSKKISEEKYLQISDSILTLSLQLDSIREKINNLDNITGSNKSEIKNIYIKLNEMNQKYDKLSTNLSKSDSGESGSSLLNTIIIALLIIIIIVLIKISMRNRRSIDDQHTETQNALDDFKHTVNQNFEKMMLTSRDDYKELVDILSYLEISDDEKMKYVFQEINSAKGNIEKLKKTVVSNFRVHDFNEDLSNLMKLYLNFETAVLKNKRVAKLYHEIDQFEEDLKNSHQPNFEYPKTAINWLKNFYATLSQYSSLSKELIQKINSPDFTEIQKVFKDKYPTEASNFNVSIKNKKWSKALEYLEKMKIETV